MTKSGLPACQVNLQTKLTPLALSSKPHSPAERPAAQQIDYEKLQRERQLRELAEAEVKERGKAMKSLWGARTAPTSFLLSQPLQALPLGHPHKVSEDGKMGKRRLLLRLREAYVQALTAVVLPMQPMASLSRSLHSNSSSSSQQWGAFEFTN